MPDIKRLPAVVYLDRNRMWYYTAGVPNILQLDFPVEVLSDLEVLSKEKLAELIKSFIETYKLAPANITLLLSPSITFEKDFPEGLPVEIEGETKSFLNFVPFEDTYNKTFKLGKNVRVIAVNQELCNDLRNAFGDQQFLITAIVPYSILQQTMPELASNLDLVYVLNHVDGIRQHSLAGQEVAVATSSTGISATKAPEPQNNKRVFLLAGVFAVLLIILGFVVYTQIIAPPAPIKSTSVVPTILPNAPATTAPVVVTPTAAVSVTQTANPATTLVPTVAR